MGVVLDTSVLVEAERGRIDLERLIAEPQIDSIAIAAITVSELLQGSIRSRTAAHRVRRIAFADYLIRGVPVLPFGLPEARRHADLWADLAERGMLIDPHDLLIAATALASGLVVATLNGRHFSRVPGLRLFDVAPFVIA